MKYTVAFTPEAEDDLLDLYNYIADHSSTTQAMRYIERIERSCMSLTTMPDRGTRRDDLCPGLRVIAFQINSGSVAILRILYGGRSVELAFPQVED